MAIFGNSGAGTQDNFFAEGVTFGSSAVLAQPGVLTSMTLQVVGMVATTTGVRGRIYRDVAGTPGALIASTNARDLATSDTGPQTFSFASPLALAAGTYWLCFSSTGGNNFQWRSFSVADLSKIQTASAPDPFVPTISSEGPAIIYATYTPTGFPTTPIIDSFPRADENPLAGGIWAAYESFDGECQLISNAATGQSVAFGSSRTNASYGFDCEGYGTITTNDAGNRSEIYVRATVGGGVASGYCVSRVGSTWSIRRRLSSSDSALGATFTQAFSAGDSFGIQALGTELTAWYKSAAGIWTSLATRTDSAITTGGQVAIRMFGTTYRLDDVGGGTIVPTTTDRLVPHHGIGLGRW